MSRSMQVRAGRIGGGPVRAAYGLAEMAAGAVQARRLLRRLAPQAVIGFGGYPSLPTMLAAASLGLPTLIHEQNAVLGRANRLLAPRAWRIATGFPETIGLRPLDRIRAVHTGNPVRPAILAVGGSGYRPPLPGGPVELLILGGSQGARILSRFVPPALAALPSGLRGGPQGQPAGAPRRSRRRRQGLCRDRHRRRGRQLLHRCAAAAGAGASGDLPRRRLDRGRTRGDRPAGARWSPTRTRPTTTRPPTPGLCRRRGRLGHRRKPTLSARRARRPPRQPFRRRRVAGHRRAQCAAASAGAMPPSIWRGWLLALEPGGAVRGRAA